MLTIALETLQMTVKVASVIGTPQQPFVPGSHGCKWISHAVAVQTGLDQSTIAHSWIE